MRTDEELTQKTMQIIERNGRILLRRTQRTPHNNDYETYLHQWSDIAGGPDNASWCYRKARKNAKEFFNLKWAHTIAPLYDCKVVVVYPKKK